MPDIPQVSPTYRHYEKSVYGHGVMQSANRGLKWYDITRSKNPIASVIRDHAKDFLADQLNCVDIPGAQDLGFVLLHQCTKDFYFLGLCTWRGNNELWKTQFYLNAAKMDDFALYPKDGQHKDTFCVWEMAVTSHESRAWTAYLRSDRTRKDAETYLATSL